ncbi:hypothetical protein FSP39_021719 [Pinctada imbricata]|uniref:Glutathione peroxidase n=1 Tax=Pinctada imbricata TaxID=66713 RepID=A0AA88XJY2_PINIB|nr:hypothetical protein FSP39_021719 [Pinctada imbricata]
MNNHATQLNVSFGGKPTPVSSVSSFYELSAPLLNGKMEQFSKYEGRVTLIVNMASCDTNTKKELVQLNDLLTTYTVKGLAILVFPCNQFARQEPLDNDEILPFLQSVRPGQKFEPKFTILSKVCVNGRGCIPIYEYLKLKQPAPQDDDGLISKSLADITWNPVMRSDIGWNYEKFLISSDGQPVRRYSHRTNVDVIKKDLESYLRRIPKSVREHLQLQPMEQRSPLLR